MRHWNRKRPFKRHGDRPLDVHGPLDDLLLIERLLLPTPLLLHIIRTRHWHWHRLLWNRIWSIDRLGIRLWNRIWSVDINWLLNYLLDDLDLWYRHWFLDQVRYSLLNYLRRRRWLWHHHWHRHCVFYERLLRSWLRLPLPMSSTGWRLGCWLPFPMTTAGLRLRLPFPMPLTRWWRRALLRRLRSWLPLPMTSPRRGQRPRGRLGGWHWEGH